MPYLPEAKIEALKVLPGAPALLDAVADTPGVYLVGGAVRDLMLGFVQFDFDLVVEGDAHALADQLAATIGGDVVKHDRFLTATFRSDDGELNVDIATARTETYERPGALPDVEPSDLQNDLRRRDFTVNAMALAIWRERLGELLTYPDAEADFAARMLRITHDQSFIDDPTRLLRLLRYGARLGFTAEPHTEDVARAAVEAGAPATVSGPRIRDELLDLLGERSAVVAIDSMYALGLDRALHEKLDADEYLASRALIDLPEGVRQDLLLLAVCSRAMDADTLAGWLEHLQLQQRHAAVVRAAVLEHQGLAARCAEAQSASELADLLRTQKPETIVFAAALPSTDPALAAQMRAWISEGEGSQLEISGADLRAAGIGEGPQIGRALAATRSASIDGRISGRDEQLRFALESARRSDR